MECSQNVGGDVTKKQAVWFFVTFFVVWVLVNPAVKVLLGDESDYLDALMQPSKLLGPLVGSVVAVCVMYVMKNKAKESS